MLEIYKIFPILNQMVLIKYHLPIIIYAVLIFIGSSISTLPSEIPDFDFMDKFIHFMEYFIFGILLWRSAYKWNKIAKSLMFITIVFSIGAFYALSDEFHQLYVPGRDGNLYDWLADIFGLAVGLATAYIFIKERNSLKIDVNE